MKTLAAAILLVFSVCAFADDELGHSSHGSAFDSGMRTKPLLLKGVGNAPFVITTKNKEVQQWFDQGNAMLHSFWFEEAERTFRWCLKLDPDCAMAYLGLARCGFTWFNLNGGHTDKEFDRYKTFLKEAAKRKETVSERERMHIEAWEAAVNKGGAGTLVEKLKLVTAKFPDDIEAKALIALFSIGRGSAQENENLIQDVLKQNPMHPGALHASIHNWDDRESLRAIRACELYGKAAPSVAHALHMPGHIYAKIGMWHEAAISMDSATRTELKYMNDRLAFPFEAWNFPHNRNYLCYIQEQLGMGNASIQGARDLLAAPRDPDLNNEDARRGSLLTPGRQALQRALIKFERWKEIMTPGFVDWDTRDKGGRTRKIYVETLALTGLGKLDEARGHLRELEDLSDSKKEPTLQVNLARAKLYLADNKVEEGEKALLAADEQDKKNRKSGGYQNDPPLQAWSVARLLGDHFRMKGMFKTAIAYYERSLENEQNDGFSLAGLALCYDAQNEKVPAERYAGRVAYVWANADADLPINQEVKKHFPNVKPISYTPAVERPYHPEQLRSFGPSNWEPFAAPNLTVKNVNGKTVRLEDYRGKNVLLVFFLGDACVHCVGQLKSINDKMADFTAADTVVLGVCSQTPKALKESVTLNPVRVTFLSDTNHENARRFASYDDFEDIELHSTILIDRQGKVRWKRTGGDPFMNIDFLLGEIKRLNKGV